MSDNKKVNKLLGEVSKKYGISKEQLESAAQSGNIENLLKNTNLKTGMNIFLISINVILIMTFLM